MQSNLIIVYTVLVFWCGYVSCDIHYDYYWRDYTGEIPWDAVEGGSDVNNETTFIGQVYVRSYGIIPVTIYPGKKSVAANIYRVYELSSYVKILCSSSKENFKWLPANSKELHLQMIGKHLVRGGVEHDSVLNIGRIHYQGEILVAKICSFNVGNAKLYFPAANREKSVESYEVLVYEPKPDKNQV